jgi:hypothetical protein
MQTFLDCYRDAIHICRSLLQEDARLFIPRERLETHVQTMKDHIQGKVSELVLSLHEVASAEWEHPKQKSNCPCSRTRRDVHQSSLCFNHRRFPKSSRSDCRSDPRLIGLARFSPRRGRHDSPPVAPHIDESVFFEYFTHLSFIRVNTGLTSEYVVLLRNSTHPQV